MIITKYLIFFSNKMYEIFWWANYNHYLVAVTSSFAILVGSLCQNEFGGIRLYKSYVTLDHEIFFGENSHFWVAYFLLWTMRIQNIYGMWGLLLHYRRKIGSSRLQKKILAYSSEYAIISIYYDSYHMIHTIWVTKTIT